MHIEVTRGYGYLHCGLIFINTCGRDLCFWVI